MREDVPRDRRRRLTYSKEKKDKIGAERMSLRMKQLQKNIRTRRWSRKEEVPFR